jgi:hypothetical protein
MNNAVICHKPILQAIRPRRESKTGWTLAPGNRFWRNQSSSQLNEHGAALNVFWIRKSGLGAEVNRKKDQDGEVISKRKDEKLPGPGARTRWVTERIASAQAMARRSASEINRRNDGFE